MKLESVVLLPRAAVALDFAKSPMTDWEKRAKAMTVDEVYGIASVAVDLALRLIRAAAYLETHEVSNHSHAVKTQNARARRVRKALGFSYPQDDVSF